MSKCTWARHQTTHGVTPYGQALGCTSGLLVCICAWMRSKTVKRLSVNEESTKIIQSIYHWLIFFQTCNLWHCNVMITNTVWWNHVYKNGTRWCWIVLYRNGNEIWDNFFLTWVWKFKGLTPVRCQYPIFSRVVAHFSLPSPLRLFHRNYSVSSAQFFLLPFFLPCLFKKKQVKCIKTSKFSLIFFNLKAPFYIFCKGL